MKKNIFFRYANFILQVLKIYKKKKLNAEMLNDFSNFYLNEFIRVSELKCIKN